MRGTSEIHNTGATLAKQSDAGFPLSTGNFYLLSGPKSVLSGENTRRGLFTVQAKHLCPLPMRA